MPPNTPPTVQLTVEFDDPLTCTASVTRWFAVTVAVIGVMLTPTPGCTRIDACAAFVGSASGVAVMTTELGPVLQRVRCNSRFRCLLSLRSSFRCSAW